MLNNNHSTQSLFWEELKTALQEAQETGKTTPVTAFKKKWLEKDDNNKLVFKDLRRMQKYRALAEVYQEYQQSMHKMSYYDFDDMIINLGYKLQTNNYLKFNLQERYQYILVDEFQDTSGAQMQILDGLITNEINEGRPNILVVGDPDQSIFKFQGANLRNLLAFESSFKSILKVELQINYRSAADIISLSQSIIQNSELRIA